MIDTKIEPKYIPFKCVTCNGYGSISYGKYICKACKGKGIIVINQETGLQVNNDDENGNRKDDSSTDW